MSGRIVGSAHLLWRLRADKRGASAVELALTLPIIAVMLMAAFDVSRAFSARLDLVQAASRTAELATSLGQVRSDYAFLTTEAAAAAVAAGADSPTVAIDAWLECNGVRQGAMNTPCAGGQAFARYVSVRISGFYQPVFAVGGLLGATRVPLRGAATVRIQ